MHESAIFADIMMSWIYWNGQFCLLWTVLDTWSVQMEKSRAVQNLPAGMLPHE